MISRAVCAFQSFFKAERRFLPTYKDAATACGGGYRDSVLVDVVAKKTIRFRDTPDAAVDLTSLRPAIASMGLTSDRLNVLDFGGACGLHYFAVKNLFSRIAWSVVETPEMTRAAAPLASPVLKFHESISEARARLDAVGGIDFVLVSGSLQYTERPREVMAELLRVPAKRILFTRTPMREAPGGRDAVFVQRSRLAENGSGTLPHGFSDREIRYPCWILDRNSFFSEVGQTHRILLSISEGGDMMGCLAEPISVRSA